MYQFINVLKIIAIILITNAHYENIYPISILANGGLLGDVIFFSVSGFCLYNIKDSFLLWYKKRIKRIYPTVILSTLICVLLGYYSFSGNIVNIIQLFIYPTKYHFIASIMLLYIIYYFILFFIKKSGINVSKGLSVTLISISVIYLIYYLVFFDKSYYHIDSVYENSIKFLFLFSMILGAWFRNHKFKYLVKIKKRNIVFFLISFFAYFISKLLFVKYNCLSFFQIINQIFLCLVLFFLITILMSLELQIQSLPNKIKSILKYLSSLSLEIYLIQYVIIDKLNIYPFPLNFIIVSISILISAYFINGLIKGFNLIMKNVSYMKKGE